MFKDGKYVISHNEFDEWGRIVHRKQTGYFTIVKHQITSVGGVADGMLPLGPLTMPTILRISHSLDNGYCDVIFVNDGLSKAVKWRDMDRVRSSHSDKNAAIIDHKPHVTQTSEEYNQILNGPKEYKNIKPGVGDISKKMTHEINGETYMSKPYHKKIESGTRSYVKHPVLGWATMATKAIFDSAGIGHLCEDVQTHEHENIPLTVHKFQKGYRTVGGEAKRHMGWKIPHDVNPLHVQQIGIMDFLMNNLDRHGGNLLVSDAMNTRGQHDLFAIDHERNFQYFKHNTEQKFGRMGARDESTLQDFVHSLGGGALKIGDHARWETDEAAEWWNENSENIKKSFNEQVGLIKDPIIRQHISDNFWDRVEVMDEAAQHGFQLNANDTWPSVRNKEKQRAPAKTAKYINSLLDQHKDPVDMLGAIHELGMNTKSKGGTAVLRDRWQGAIGKLTPEQMVEYYDNFKGLRHDYIDKGMVRELFDTIVRAGKKDHMRAFLDYHHKETGGSESYPAGVGIPPYWHWTMKKEI